jgi:hypothetical protein
MPQGWPEDKPLGRWVNNQRSFTRKLDRGDPNPGITAVRAAKLDALGFTWELLAAANNASWEAQLVKLKAYKR